MSFCRRAARLVATVLSRESTETASPRRQSRGGDSTAGLSHTRGRVDRGQAELIGTVLIFGLSIAVIGVSLALGGAALSDLTSTAESANVENGMSHLSSKVSLVALGDSDSQRFDLGATREGTVSVQPEAGNITLYNVSNGSRNMPPLFDDNLGAIVYEGQDREVAYQGGGIWTKRGANSTLSSPPEYYYRGTTLTLPIIQVTGEGAVGGQANGRITPVGAPTEVAEQLPSPLDSGVIEIEIQSEYYEGWYSFFTQRAEGSTTIDHSNNTVVSTLTVPDEVTFDKAVSVQNDYDASGSTDINGSVEENTAHRSSKPIVETKVKEATEDGTGNGCLGESDCTLTKGTYFYNGDLTLGDNLDINTSSGNVTVIVDGSFDIDNNEVTVTDTDTNNGTTYYVNGSLRAQGNGYVGTDNPAPEPQRNVFYVADGFLDDSTGGGTITLEAIIYAPDADVDSNGNVDIVGSLVANSLDIGGNFYIENDPDKFNITLEITGASDLLTYFHVSHNIVRVDLD